MEVGVVVSLYVEKCYASYEEARTSFIESGKSHQSV